MPNQVSMLLSRTMYTTLLSALASVGAAQTSPLDPIDFTASELLGFGEQNVSNDFEISETGALTLRNNTWVYIPLRYTVTPTTVLEFDLTLEGSEPEFAAIGFERDLLDSEAETIRLGGIQNYGNLYLPQFTAGETRRVRVDVGRVIVNRFYHNLTFVRDHDTSPSGSIRFENVRLYEQPYYSHPVLNWETYPLAIFPSSESSSLLTEGVHLGSREGLELSRNTSAYIDLGNYPISRVTRLSFDVLPLGAEPSVMGVGLLSSLDLGSGAVYQVGGTADVGTRLEPAAQPGISTRYSIDLGAEREGESFRYLAFLREDDAATTGTVTYGNVQLFEDYAGKTSGWFLQ